MPSVDQIQTHVPTKFQWSQSWGNHVCIAGSFDPPIPTWHPILMEKNKDNVNEVTLDLLPDKIYHFKFVIDGNWVLDDGFPSCPDSSGNWNHEIQVNLPPPPPPPEEDHKEEHHYDHQVVTEVHKEEHHYDHQVVTEDHKEEQHQEDQVVTEDHKEEHHQEDQVVTEDHKEEQHQEDQVVTEDHKEEQHQEDQVVTEDHKEEHHQEYKVVTEDHKEEQHHDHQVVTEDHKEEQHQEEQVVVEEQVLVVEEQVVVVQQVVVVEQQVVVVEEDKEEKHHQQVVTDMDENKQQNQEEKEEQNQHQEDLQVVEELHEHHHHEDEQKEQHNEDQIVTEMNTTEQSCDDTVTNVSISEAIETETIINETIINETMVEQSDLSKETMIEPDNDKLSAEHVANTTDNVIIDDESMTTLHTPQNDTDKVTEISEIEGLNIEQSDEIKIIEDNEIMVTENNEIKVTEEDNEIKVTENNEIKVTEGTLSMIDETVVSSTTETEIPIESSTDEIKVETNKPERETMNKNEDDDEDDYDDCEKEGTFEGAEGSENIIVVYEEHLNEETLKEVLLNNTWAMDDSLEDTIPSSWTEKVESPSVIWPDDTNLEWSDINKETSDETANSEETETTNKLETEVEDYSEHEETRVTEITSNDESIVEEVVSCEIHSTVLVEETITVKPVEEIFAQSIVESHREKDSDEIGINNKVPTEPSFVQYEKPESSATADKNISALPSIPTTVVAAPAVEQHSCLDEEITSSAIDKPEVEYNISRKIISISPNISPGESTRNADIYPHNITVATNTSKETVNIKSKHKKPVVEITSRGILHKGSKLIIQPEEEEEEKIDLVNISYLVTSVTTTFTLGVISMLYKSVFKQ